MAAQPTLPIQFSVPVEARKDLRRLALDISDDIVPKGELRYTEMCSYAALYLLSCGNDESGRDEVRRIVRAGMAHETVYGSGPEAKVDEPEPEAKPSAPVKPLVKPPVNAASVWKETTSKPDQGDVKGLDSDRPAARKVRKTPRRK